MKKNGFQALSALALIEPRNYGGVFVNQKKAASTSEAAFGLFDLLFILNLDFESFPGGDAEGS